MFIFYAVIKNTLKHAINNVDRVAPTMPIELGCVVVAVGRVVAVGEEVQAKLRYRIRSETETLQVASSGTKRDEPPQSQ